ncbi:hypothetical protein HBA55_29155 [Pseudomaricurvus alkylphenolicus]|jgi:hypothetical protein|uniref:hypothetical protein n=1 Tax=Pseudomaricurvus alkylphenolicus TaxID=1306991 RepID=UPI00142198AB|nr:hypothetical protein [Pseudomaricurvus alkylphenolicus]NIB43709.1 hypothetical protein [Pseudomaricurvus alkylphenolicus]
MFGKKRKPATALSIAMLSSAAFIALAIYGWDLPTESALRFFWMSAIMVGGMMIAAVIMVLLIRLLRRLSSRD